MTLRGFQAGERGACWSYTFSGSVSAFARSAWVLSESPAKVIQYFLPSGRQLLEGRRKLMGASPGRRTDLTSGCAPCTPLCTTAQMLENNNKNQTPPSPPAGTSPPKATSAPSADWPACLPQNAMNVRGRCAAAPRGRRRPAAAREQHVLPGSSARSHASPAAAIPNIACGPQISQAADTLARAEARQPISGQSAKVCGGRTASAAPRRENIPSETGEQLMNRPTAAGKSA